MSVFDADSKELRQILKEKLSSSGVLNSLEGKLRAQLFGVICPESLKFAPTPAKDTMIINELIREYLKWNGYVGALAVFSTGIILMIY